MSRLLRHKDILQPGTVVHFTRAMLTRARPKELHSHDFFELFWVQNGTVRHHLTSGAELLHEGALILMHPGQTHALQGKGDHAMVVSLCLLPKVVIGLADRHDGLLDLSAEHPLVAHRDIRQLAALNHAALQLEHGTRDALAAEAFLLPLLAELKSSPAPDAAPDWLLRAMQAAQAPDVFRDGAAGLVRAAGRAHPHVSRTMRSVTGRTPSEYVNDIRMRFAARALITDGDPVSDIAVEVGIPNMAHFHKLFRAHHGITPLQYRRKLQRDVVQP